jgi:hypothetical protein
VGTIETPGSWPAYSFTSTSNHRSSLRDGRVFFTISRHFVPGYYQMSLWDINGLCESASEVLRVLGLNDRAHSSRLAQGGLTLDKSSLPSAKPLKIEITYPTYGYFRQQCVAITQPLACIAHKSLEICERCRLWQRNSPTTPEITFALRATPCPQSGKGRAIAKRRRKFRCFLERRVHKHFVVSIPLL